LIDILDTRQLFIEVNETLEERIAEFSFSISDISAKSWAEQIRTHFGINLSTQYSCPTPRQFYLYLKDRIEARGVFVQCFSNVPIETARGIAVYYNLLPIIGINAADRPPAKSFSIIHELVHIINRSSSMCNDMYNSFTSSNEEVFCNAVAGEVLVPEEALKIVLQPFRNRVLSVEIIEQIAKQFCVSKEVIIRRLLDITPAYISKIEYQTFADEFLRRIEQEKADAKQARAEGRAQMVYSSPSRDSVDKTSIALSRSFLYGYGDGVFSKQDIARYLGIAQRHVDKYLQEVASWNR